MKTEICNGIEVQENYKVTFNSYTPDYLILYTFFEGMGVVIQNDNTEEVPMDFWYVILDKIHYQKFLAWVINKFPPPDSESQKYAYRETDF